MKKEKFVCRICVAEGRRDGLKDHGTREEFVKHYKDAHGLVLVKRKKSWADILLGGFVKG